MQQNGQFVQADYFDMVGGINIADSPMRVKEDQLTGGLNLEYSKTGGFNKRRGPMAINTTADAELITRGMALHKTATGTQSIIRAAGSKIQYFDDSSLVFTNLTLDAATTSDVFSSTEVVNTVYTQFNTANASMLNFAGGTNGVYAVLDRTQYTKNGVVEPLGSFTATVSATTVGAFLVTGTYYYSVGYIKDSTLARSNAALDLSFTVTSTTQSVFLNFAGLTNDDSSLFSKLVVYRSAVGGVSAFTAGDLVAELTLPVTTYTDTGSALLESENIPRANSAILDNSVLPSGTYDVVATWKRRLVTAKGSDLYISELNAPESWPVVNYITIPSGGPITGLGVISFNTDFGNDEYLAIFKEQELWLLKGNTYEDFTLSFIDSVGCATQALIVTANGFLTWVDYRGIYIWDGANKPIYCSRPIEPLFDVDGDLDKTNLEYGFGVFYHKKNQIIWILSHKVYGLQKFGIRLDVRLTMPQVQQTLSGRILDGVFSFDQYSVYQRGGFSYLPEGSFDEKIILGDDSGFVHTGYSLFSDNGSAIELVAASRFQEMGNPNKSKRFHKVILWVEELGNWDVSLDYWANYRAQQGDKSTLSQPVSTIQQSTQSLWDVAYWDVAFWDDYSAKLTGITFNLHNEQGNAEGDCLRFQVRQNGTNEPFTLYGYSVIYTEKALSK